MSSLQLRPGHWLLRCPLCKSGFTTTAGALACRNGHSFDLAREGYVNLLLGRRRRPAAGGDSPSQLRHRALFLDAGHLGTLTTTIVRQIERSARGPQHVLDAGSGTGHHVARIAAKLPNSIISLGLDISKDAARQAARRWPTSAFAVADLGRVAGTRRGYRSRHQHFRAKELPRNGARAATRRMARTRLSGSRSPDRPSGSLRASAPARSEFRALRRCGHPLRRAAHHLAATEPRGTRSGGRTSGDPDGSQCPPCRSNEPRCRPRPPRRHLRHERPFRPKTREEVMTIRIVLFDPHTASDELWAAFNETRRGIAREFWPDEPILDDAETRREVQTTNPMVEFRRWVVMEGEEVAGSIRAAFRRPGTPHEEDYARFLWASGGVRASSRSRGIGTLLLREVHRLMHALDKTVLTMSAQTEPGHAFIKYFGAVEKHCTVEQRAVFADLDWPRVRQWEDRAAAQGLSWARYAGRVPRDVLVDLLPVFTELFADVPRRPGDR